MNLSLRNYNQGFTLLELMVAVAVFSIMAAIAYDGLNNVLIAKTHTEQQAEKLYELQKAVNWLTRDIEQIVSRGVRDEYGEFLKPVVGNEFEGYFLEFTRGGWRNPANQPRSHLQRVAYGVRDEKLIRLYWRVLDRAEDSKPLENVLMEGVKEVKVRFLTSSDEWQTSWPAQALGTQQPELMPRAIEVNIETKEFGIITRLMRVVI